MTELVVKLSELNRRRKRITEIEIIEFMETICLVAIFITCTYAIAPIV